jgi:hypothetical protein
MDWTEIDWTALERLRRLFLEGTAGQRDYWRSDTDLISYDLTFAQRIGWKWDYVLQELVRRGWGPPAGDVLDWGCGSGVAGRAFLDHFGDQSIDRLLLWDRSSRAVGFAATRARERHSQVRVEPATPGQATTGVLLLSHVLTELDAGQTDILLEQIVRPATSVLWVEPGTYEASRQLGQIRERLRENFHVAAPCTHSKDCPVFAAGNESHWCHHFASPPPAVFTDGDWARFAELAGVDLRSLPLSFLVLDKRPLHAVHPGAVRILGRPRVFKAHALLLGCSEEGLREGRLNKRNLPAEFRALKKERAEPLQAWTCQGDEIINSTEL